MPLVFSWIYFCNFQILLHLLPRWERITYCKITRRWSNNIIHWCYQWKLFKPNLSNFQTETIPINDFHKFCVNWFPQAGIYRHFHGGKFLWTFQETIKSAKVKSSPYNPQFFLPRHIVGTRKFLSKGCLYSSTLGARSSPSISSTLSPNITRQNTILLFNF